MANYIWPEITEDTPIEEVKRIHRDIWNYVIEYGIKPITPYKFNCIACEYDAHYKGMCESCPIIWPADIDGDECCYSLSSDSGLYDRWGHATGEKKTELARQIRDLPWKFECEENTPL